MGLSLEEWARLTPRVLVLRMKRHAQNERKKDYRAGVLAALFANAHRDPKKYPKGFGWEDFFGPDPFRDEDAELRANLLRFKAYLRGLN